MNRPLILVALLLTFAFSSSQEYTFGLKGGFNSSSIGDINHRGGSVETGSPDVIFAPDSEMGNLFGAFMTVEFDRLFIRGEANYVNQKNAYPFWLKTSYWTSKKFDVPILVGYKVLVKPMTVSIYAGPGLNYISDMKLDGTESPIAYKKSATNLNIGVMADLGRVGIDLRYEYGLQPITEQRVNIVRAAYGTNLADVLEYNPSQITLSIHVNIIRTNKDKLSGLFANLFRGNKCRCTY